MTDLPASVTIHEEGPREGFQFERAVIPTARKIELVNALAETGLVQIQVASFVNPKAVPGMSDAEEVVAAMKRVPGVRYTGLWLNERGFQRALATGRLDLAGYVTLTASEVFLRRNQQRSYAEDVAEQRRLASLYRQNGLALNTVAVMAAFGCNFAGDIPVAHVLDVVRDGVAVAEAEGYGVKTIALADTMAWATPGGIRRIVGAVRDRYPEAQITLHLHDTRGLALANAYAGLQMGVRVFDAAVGGLGGCPFAAHKGAAGNVCTEDLVFMLHEMGVPTGVDLERLIACARLAEEIVGHPLAGKVKVAGSLAALREALAPA